MLKKRQNKSCLLSIKVDTKSQLILECSCTSYKL